MQNHSTNIIQLCSSLGYPGPPMSQVVVAEQADTDRYRPPRLVLLQLLIAKVHAERPTTDFLLLY